MTVVYPTPLADLWTGIGVVTCSLALSDTRTISRANNGAAHITSQGSRLWYGRVVARKQRGVSSALWRARIERQLNPWASFLVADTLLPAPQADPDGSILDVSAPVIASVASPQITIAGLPVGYVLTEADYIGVMRGSTRLLYRAAEGATADAGGQATLTVDPPPLLAIVAGDPVHLLMPSVRMIVAGGSYTPPMMDQTFTGEIVFDMQEAPQ